MVLPVRSLPHVRASSARSFVFLESAVILAIVVLGGMGSLVGIAIAAIVMIGGTEILREMSFLKIIFGPDFTPELYRMLIFGLAMVGCHGLKPRGFVGSREPSAFLNAERRWCQAPLPRKARLMAGTSIMSGNGLNTHPPSRASFDALRWPDRHQ